MTLAADPVVVVLKTPVWGAYVIGLPEMLRMKGKKVKTTTRSYGEIAEQ